jgi:hypothetical protein
MTKFSIDLETLYRETRNPLYAWAALADYEACPNGAPLPAWIMGYLREAAMALELMADAASPGEAARKVNAALGLTGKGKNAFAEYRLIARAESAAFIDAHRREIFVHRTGKPDNASVSRDWVAKATGVKTDKTVGNWIRRIRQLRAAQERK